MRAVHGLPSFRRQVLYRAFMRAFRRTRRPDFRIVEFSVQDNHVHLIVEALDKGALARGIASFAVRANRLFNLAWGRKRGRVWDDRYHRRDLRAPKQVRNALLYCLNNLRKHTRIPDGYELLDSRSSARWFRGGQTARPPDEAPTRPTQEATTFLLRVGWMRHGLLDPCATPGAPG